MKGLLNAPLSLELPLSWYCVHKIYGSGLNVNFDGRRAITEAPASVTSIQVRDAGRITQTDMVDIHCSNCEGHVGWKIVRIR